MSDIGIVWREPFDSAVAFERELKPQGFHMKLVTDELWDKGTSLDAIFHRAFIVCKILLSRTQMKSVVRWWFRKWSKIYMHFPLVSKGVATLFTYLSTAAACWVGDVPMTTGNPLREASHFLVDSMSGGWWRTYRVCQWTTVSQLLPRETMECSEVCSTSIQTHRTLGHYFLKNYLAPTNFNYIQTYFFSPIRTFAPIGVVQSIYGHANLTHTQVR